MSFLTAIGHPTGHSTDTKFSKGDKYLLSTNIQKWILSFKFFVNVYLKDYTKRKDIY